MKLKFEPHLEYQTNAIAHFVVDLFKGQQESDSNFAVPQFGLLGQEERELPIVWTRRSTRTTSKRCKHDTNCPAPSIADKGYNFDIEMETGTGKTYVYLRSIMESHQKYG